MTNFRHLAGKVLWKTANILLQSPKPVPKFTWACVPGINGISFDMFLDVNNQTHGQMATGHYDKLLFEKLNNAKIDWSGLAVWDVGAHIGYHTLYFASLVGPLGRVTTFEPNPHNVKRMQQNL